MTADLDAQPRLTKHFDSPFVVRLRLCFSPFFIIIVLLLFKSLRKIPGVCYLSPPIIIIRVAPTRRHGCQYMFFQGKVDSLRSIIAAFTLVLEYGCPGILVVLFIVGCSAYEDICPSIPRWCNLFVLIPTVTASISILTNIPWLQTYYGSY